MTRRRLLAMGVVGMGALASGDAVRVETDHGTAQARGRAAPPHAHHHRSRPPAPPPSPAPLPPLAPRREAVHRVHEILPSAPPNAIALTIDDGPHPEWTPKVLDLLAAQGVTATFCLIGVNVQRFPRLAQRIAGAGHQITNHTMNHPLRIASMPFRAVDREITEAHDRIADVTGVAPKFFRSPGGAWSRAVFGAAARHGMVPIDWDVDPRDWARPGIGSIRRTMLAAKGGDILLCHDGGGDRSETIKALRQVIPRLRARGLTFVSL